MFGKLFAHKTIRATLASAILLAGVGVATAEDGDLARGEQLYALCTKCHMTNGSGNSEALAPAIAGMPSWYVETQLKNFANGIRGLHAGDTGGLRMYPMSRWLRSEADQRRRRLRGEHDPDPPGQGARGGGQRSREGGLLRGLQRCHSAAGEGNQGMGAPPLAGQYLLSSIQKYRAKIRGSGAGDPYGVAMQAMVGTLADEAAIVDVIAHIESLGN